MPYLQTIYAENQNSVTFTSGTQDRVTISVSELVEGRTYLLLWKGLFGKETGGGGYDLLINGSLVSEQSAQQSCPVTQPQLKEMSGLHVFTMPSEATEGVVLRAKSTTPTGTKRWSSEQVLLLEISRLTQNTDWFFDENNTSEVVPASYGSETNPASITFTPDGTSDYLILGSVQFELSTDDDGVWAIRDTTSPSILAQCGQGGEDVGVADQAKNLRMYAMAAPSSAPVTIQTSYRGVLGISKESAQLFILRLDAFRSHGIYQIDLNGVAPGSEIPLTFAVPVTPHISQKVMMLGSFMGEMRPILNSGDGYRCRILHRGVEVSRSQALELSAFVNISRVQSQPQTDTLGGENLFTVLENQPQTSGDTVGYGIPARPPSGEDLAHVWRNQTLAVFIPDFFDFTPPEVFNQNPSPQSTEQDRLTDIKFTIGSGGEVVLASIQVSIQINSGAFIPAVVNGVVQFPFLGPRSVLVQSEDDVSVTLDYQGIFPAWSEITVQIDGDAGGDPMPQTVYSFRCARTPVEGIQILQIAR